MTSGQGNQRRHRRRHHRDPSAGSGAAHLGLARGSPRLTWRAHPSPVRSRRGHAHKPEAKNRHQLSKLRRRLPGRSAGAPTTEAARARRARGTQAPAGSRRKFGSGPGRRRRRAHHPLLPSIPRRSPAWRGAAHLGNLRWTSPST